MYILDYTNNRWCQLTLLMDPVSNERREQQDTVSKHPHVHVIRPFGEWSVSVLPSSSIRELDFESEKADEVWKRVRCEAL